MCDMSRIGLFLLYGCLLSKNSSALTCFNCPGIRHPRFCEYVKECIDGQVCGLERQVESNGAVIFSLGCLSQNTCNTNPSIVDGRQKCFNCCSTDLCNIYGCGEPDLSTANGTACYNCVGLLEPKACRSISFCDKSELCYLEEKTHFGEKFYQNGCKEKHICEAQFISNPIIGRRDTIQRKSTTHLTCCDINLCNNEGYGNKQTTHLSTRAFTSYSTSTSVSTTNLPDICTINGLCYNGATCQTLNGSYKCICAVGYLGKQCEYADGKDFSFIIGFCEGYAPLSTLPKILVVSKTTAHLSILNFNNNQNKSVTIDKSNVEYNLSNTVLPSDGIHLAGVKLHSDVRIKVYGFLDQTTASGGFLAMPLRFASIKYIIPTLPSYISYHGFKNLLAITAVYENTDVYIDLKLVSGFITYERRQYGNNDTIRILMNKYNTFQLSTAYDLSGTLVTASKPVIAVSGNQCNTALTKYFLADCNPFIESVLPTNQLDNMFITPNTWPRLSNTVRIQATNSTSLTIKTGHRTTLKTLSAREFWDFYYSTISFIFASDDILVMSYPHGLPEQKGDPFMMTIPGVNQYLYEYDFAVPTGFVSFISITVQRDAVDGFLIDGNSYKVIRALNISEGEIHFSTFSLHISAGFHHIEHGKKVRFGLWVYGSNTNDGYGYPAGMAYKIYN